MPGTVLDDVVGATITTARRAVLRTVDADEGPPAAGRWELVDLATTGVAELRGAQVVAVEWEHDTSGAPVGVRVALDGGGAVRLRSSSGDLHVEAERHP